MNIVNSFGKRTLNSAEVISAEHFQDQKKLKKEIFIGIDTNQTAASLLQLPTDILRKIACLINWRSSDSFHLSLTCKRLKRILESRPQICLAKILSMISQHPLTYCQEGPHPRLIQCIPSLFSAIIILPEDQFTKKDWSYFQGFKFKVIIAEVLLQAPFPIHFVPFIAAIVKNVQMDISPQTYQSLAPAIQEAYDWRSEKFHAFQQLLADDNWTREKIEGIDWPFLFKEKDDDEYENIKRLLGDPLWRQRVGNAHQQNPLTDECLLFLLYFADFGDPINYVQDLFEDVMPDKCDDRDFIFKATKITAWAYECCSDRLKHDRALLLHAAKYDARAFGNFCPSHFCCDKEIFLAAATSDNPDTVLEEGLDAELEKELETNQEFLLECLKVGLFDNCDEYNFFLSSKFFDDENFMRKAIKYSPSILEQASPRLKNSKKMVKRLIRFQETLCGVSEDLLTDESIITAYIEKTGDLKNIPSLFRKKENIVLKAIARNYKAFLDVDDSLKENRHFILTAINCNPFILLLMKEISAHPFLNSLFKELIQDRSFILKLFSDQSKQTHISIEDYHSLFESPLFPTHFKKDAAMALAATKQCPALISEFDPALLVHEQFITALVPLESFSELNDLNK